MGVTRVNSLSSSYIIEYLKSIVRSLSYCVVGQKEVSEVRRGTPLSKGAKCLRKRSKDTHSKTLM